jgi:hyperosmotically inducible protein
MPECSREPSHDLETRITDQVRMKLAVDAVVKGGALGVAVKDGVVTLSGSVAQAKQRQKAERLARSVKGVKQVVNTIQVQGQGKAKPKANVSGR